MTNQKNAIWRKSSHSGAQDNECVELAALTGRIGIRDSKNPGGGHLTVSVESFAALLARVKRDEFGL